MNSKDIIELFIRAAASPGMEAGQWKKEHGKGIVGFLLTDVPEELIHAAGFLPYAVNAEEGRLEFADAHLQTWACSFTRNSLAAAVEGKLPFLDGLIIPQTCDTTRMLMGIWKHVMPLPYMENFRLPRQVERPSAREYLRGELARLKKSLETYRGSAITDDELRKSFSLFNNNRNLLRQLYLLHVESPQLLSDKELFVIIKAAMVMPREKLNDLLEQLLALLEKEREKYGSAEKIRLLLSGTLLEPLEILDYVAEAGGIVVSDDFQNGSRYLEGDVAETGDPMEALAERQITRMPAAMYDPEKHKRTNYLLNQVREKAVDGVLFLHLKFCEPENYDYYDNMQAMEKEGIPAMRVETAYGGLPQGQLQTRIHAFIEMLGGGDTD